MSATCRAPIVDTQTIDATPTRNPRYKSLDIWRGFACLMVVVGHSSPYEIEGGAALHSFWERAVHFCLTYSWTGVPIFFVISGYCIAATSDSSRRKESPLRHFFFRRFRRIYPAYWICIGLFLPMIAGIYLVKPDLLSDAILPIPHPSSLSAIQWLGNITLTEHWRHHFLGDSKKYFLMPAWSLCYEEQFYAICGVTVGLFPKKFFKAILWLSILTFIPAVLYFSSLYVWLYGFFFDGLWLLFAAGVLVYYQVLYASPGEVKICRYLIILAIIISVAIRFSSYVVGSSFGGIAEHKFRAVQFIAGFSCALIISLLHSKDAAIYGARLLKPLRLCGQMCYSLYLIHWPITKVVSHLFHEAGIRGILPTLTITIPVAVAISIACSWGFYQLVEKRFLNPPITTA